MKKTLELTLKQAQDIYKTADVSVKELLEVNFSKRELIGRPIGVWCLTKDKKAVKAEDWKDGYEPIGVGVVTQDTAFIVHLKPQATLPFGSTDVKGYADVVYDTETYDNLTATASILLSHNGVKGKMWEDDKFPFVGSPAAEYCIMQNGYLPTLATAKVIPKNIKEINEAMMTVGGAVVCGWLWTSTVKKESKRSFVVYTHDGDVDSVNRLSSNDARAVSAFHFEDFEF